MSALVLYQRSGCHLCDDMRRQLEQLRSERGFSLALVDVDASPELGDRYGHLVPVLEDAQGNEICHFFLDLDRLHRYMDSGLSDTMGH